MDQSSYDQSNAHGQTLPFANGKYLFRGHVEAI